MIDVKFVPKDDKYPVRLEFDREHLQKLSPDEARQLCTSILDALDMDVLMKAARVITDNHAA